jgi:hypothetical protein
VALTVVWAAWTGWSLLGQTTPFTLRVLDDVGVPISEAVIDIDGSQIGTTGIEGKVDMEWNRSSRVIEVSAPGHISRTVTIDDSPAPLFDVVLNARVLRGRVLDVEGQPVEAVLVTAGPAQGITDEEGRFDLRGAEPGTVTAERPAWVESSFTWDGGPGEAVVTVEPFAVRAVHISGEAVSKDLDTFIDMAKSTELNALMIDLKDESGYVWYNSQDPTALAVGAVSAIYDLGSVVQQAHAESLYVIGRLVIFQDPVAAVGKPSMAVWDSDLNQPYRANGQYFLDPTDPEARAYAMALAAEVCELGVDEVQFDYVRFPDVRPESAQFDGGVSPDVRVATVTGFLRDAVALLHPMGCAVGADIFGFLTAARDDGGIGQRWEDIAEVVDVASPMVYPSHYGADFYGYENPNNHPSDMVRRALEDAMDRLPRSVVVRPWLQDFGYSTESVRAQIDSAEAFGLGWMLWNAKSEVTTAALGPPE